MRERQKEAGEQSTGQRRIEGKGNRFDSRGERDGGMEAWRNGTFCTSELCDGALNELTYR